MEQIVRERIIESAAQLFAENGFGRVSLQDVASLAGIEPHEIFELFECEKDLYMVVLESLFNTYSNKMSDAFKDSNKPPENLEAFAKTMCDLHKQVPYLFTLYYRELLAPSEQFEPVVLKNIRHVAYLSDNNFAKGVQKEIFRHGINPAMATLMFAGMFHYYFLAKEQIKSLLPKTFDDEEFMVLALKVFLNGLHSET
jgi:AcrR family transcriptional regulator